MSKLTAKKLNINANDICLFNGKSIVRVIDIAKGGKGENDTITYRKVVNDILKAKELEHELDAENDFVELLGAKIVESITVADSKMKKALKLYEAAAAGDDDNDDDDDDDADEKPVKKAKASGGSSKKEAKVAFKEYAKLIKEISKEDDKETLKELKKEAKKLVKKIEKLGFAIVTDEDEGEIYLQDDDEETLITRKLPVVKKATAKKKDADDDDDDDDDDDEPKAKKAKKGKKGKAKTCGNCKKINTDACGYNNVDEDDDETCEDYKASKK